jgi:hypothetical protein
MALYGRIIEADRLNNTDKETMFSLMDEFYDHMTPSVFLKDLSEKDYCLLLLDDGGRIQGFSTQKIMNVKVGEESIWGVFSGDTIIHRDSWGSLELYRVFAEYFIEYGKQYPAFYWFLISKGYKTYKMLPLFFNTFYPNYKTQTPEFEQAVMHSFGREKYPVEYEEASGVICYRGVKDKLKEGVADITEIQRKDKNIKFFEQENPGYLKGDDLVCLARLSGDNLRKTAHRLLLGKG